MVKTRIKETKKRGIFVKFSENAKRENKGKDTKMGFFGIFVYWVWLTDLEMKQRERNREGMLMEIKEIEGGTIK